MTEKDIKKSLSLKSHKNTGAKQSKATTGSKNVTIQVRRKKIIRNHTWTRLSNRRRNFN